MADLTPGAGDVPITLDGKEMALRPTLAACMAISSIGGGLNAAVQRCLQLDFETIVRVITAGLGLNPQQAKMVPEAVFRAGLIALSAPCIDFINVVANGGRPLPDEDDQDGEGDGSAAENPPEPASP